MSTDTYEPSEENERRRRLTILEDGILPQLMDLSQEEADETESSQRRRRLSWVGGHTPGQIPDNDGLEEHQMIEVNMIHIHISSQFGTLTFFYTFSLDYVSLLPWAIVLVL